MQQFNRILDYIIEQADRNDARNLQFEQDILFRIGKAKANIFERMVTRGQGCETLTDMQNMLPVLETMLDILKHEIQYILEGKFKEYYNMGYRNTDGLIDVGLDVERRFQRNVKEITIVRDEDTIDYIQGHAFEMLTGYTNNIIQQLRAGLGDLILKKSADRATVQAYIQRTLDVNPSKAKEIAQTELSRAYNFGVLERLRQYQLESGRKVRKYWHGFMYSSVTCEHCRGNIGKTFDLDDDSETLPAHPRCRCVWLPMLEGWDEPVDRGIIARANMLTTGYSEEQIYTRINSRLGIDYGEYLKLEDAVDYLQGDRTPAMMSKIKIARDQAITSVKSNFQILSEQGSDVWSKRFNTQMSFWKTTVAEAIVDKNYDLLDKAHEGIKAVMLLPWSAQQMSKWERLLHSIENAQT